MNDEARLVFAKYAIPCSGTIVKRGNMTQEQVDQLIGLVVAGKAPEDGVEKRYPVADAMCKQVAKRMGKGEVDADVVREYFLIGHSAVVDDRYELMKDFDPVDCKTYSGTVLKVDGAEAEVRTLLGSRNYRTDWTNGLKPGDKVVVHWNFVVERMPDRFLGRMAGVGNE